MNAPNRGASRHRDHGSTSPLAAFVTTPSLNPRDRRASTSSTIGDSTFSNGGSLLSQRSFQRLDGLAGGPSRRLDAGSRNRERPDAERQGRAESAGRPGLDVRENELRAAAREGMAGPGQRRRVVSHPRAHVGRRRAAGAISTMRLTDEYLDAWSRWLWADDNDGASGPDFAVLTWETLAADLYADGMADGLAEAWQRFEGLLDWIQGRYTYSESAASGFVGLGMPINPSVGPVLAKYRMSDSPATVDATATRAAYCRWPRRPTVADNLIDIAQLWREFRPDPQPADYPLNPVPPLIRAWQRVQLRAAPNQRDGRILPAGLGMAGRGDPRTRRFFMPASAAGPRRGRAAVATRLRTAPDRPRVPAGAVRPGTRHRCAQARTWRAVGLATVRRGRPTGPAAGTRRPRRR